MAARGDVGGRGGRVGAPIRGWLGDWLGGGEPLDRATVAILAGINVLVLVNALVHDPRVNWDGAAHAAYLRTLGEGRLPAPEESYEFFNPPLVYLLPAAVDALLRTAGLGERVALGIAVKAGQLLNVVWSLLLTAALVRISAILAPRAAAYRRATLLCLAFLPVYYKTFAFHRPEPLLAALSVLAALQALELVHAPGASTRRALALGAVCGLALLTRQWAVFPLAALGAWLVLAAWVRADERVAIVRRSALAALAAALVAAPFYLHLWRQYGSPATHRGQAARISSPELLEYVWSTGEGSFFTGPVRPALAGHAGPILYSEIWGDYWCYWLVWARRPGVDHYEYGVHLENARAADPPIALETNYDAMGAYLGAANVAALLPVAVMAVTLVVALRRAATLLRAAPAEAELLPALPTLVVAVTAAGFAIFLVFFSAPPHTRTAKAGYVLHVFPFWALLAARLLEDVRGRSPRAHRLLVAALLAAAAFFVPLLVTRFPTLLGGSSS